jgi:MtfA peptidase
MRIVKPSTVSFQGALAAIIGGGVGLVAAGAVPGGAWIGALVAFAVLLLGLRKPLRRWRAARRRFAPEYRDWLRQHVPMYAVLDAPARRRFERDIRFYLAEQKFEAVEGVELTDDLRLAVAAGAALLLHGRPDWELPTNRTVLFYPERFGDDYYADDYAEFDGMVHPQGPIIFSAPAVEESWAHPGRGSNVVLHELAHLFDFANSDADGMPSLLDPASEQAWNRLVRREMRLAGMGRSLLRRYAGTHPAEFFAVAVENFFDRPEALRNRHPQVFEAMQAVFNLNPITGERPGGMAIGGPDQGLDEAASEAELDDSEEGGPAEVSGAHEPPEARPGL